MALLAAMKDGKVTPANLGPANVARLRTHPNRQVARQAAALLETLSPAGRAKADIIASLTPEVEKPGDAVKGKDLFTGACSTCHKLGTLGKVEVGPPLNGMGAHGRAALLMQIIDPNREVDPSFWQWNVTTKKGETLTGVIAGENASGLTLRNTNGDVVVAKEDIATRENTRRSLMPEGLEALGPEALRDILTFIVANGSPTAAGDDQRFRIIDLRGAYTADSRRGLRREDERDETVTLHRFGDVSVAGVPFFVMDPVRSLSGANLVALKGGPGSGIIADEFPRRVEIPTAVTAASLHFLGGVGGWAWPTGGDAARGTPAMKVTVIFADGTTQEHVLKNGETFADTFGRAEVPLSSDAGDFTRRGQVRYFALNLGKRAALAKIVLESYDNDIVPVTVAITASSEPAAAKSSASSTSSGQGQTLGPKEGGRGDAPLPETKPIVWAPGKTKVLIIGGGSSHNFGQFFGGTDGATLIAAGFSVNYTEDRDQAAAEIGNADVAIISVNRQFFDTPEYRKALFAFAAAGKGLVMLHPGTWYGFAQWPELNATIVGGGARGHDRIAAFSVNAVKPEHPIMKGVPASFSVEDELYYLNAEAEKVPQGTSAIDVLAETSPSVKFMKPHPAVWTTSHPTARIVGITLGHDQRVHDLEPFKTLLVNAVQVGRALEAVTLTARAPRNLPRSAKAASRESPCHARRPREMTEIRVIRVPCWIGVVARSVHPSRFSAQSSDRRAPRAPPGDMPRPRRRDEQQRGARKRAGSVVLRPNSRPDSWLEARRPAMSAAGTPMASPSPTRISRVSQDHADDGFSRGAERHPQSHLARPLHDRERHQPVEAHRRQHECDDAEKARQAGDQAFPARADRSSDRPACGWRRLACPCQSVAPPHERAPTTPVACSRDPDVERHLAAAGSGLKEWLIDEGRGVLLEARISAVLDHADDLPHPRTLIDEDSLPDRALAVHDLPHERLVDDADERRTLVEVAFGEITPGAQRDVHRREVVRVDHHLRNARLRAVGKPHRGRSR